MRFCRYSGTDFGQTNEWSQHHDRNFNNRSAQNRNQHTNPRSRSRDQYRDRHTVERERYGNRPPDHEK